MGRSSSIRSHRQQVDDQSHCLSHAACRGCDSRGRDVDVRAAKGNGFVDMSFINQCPEHVVPIAFVLLRRRFT
jgi:hypothetical protein